MELPAFPRYYPLKSVRLQEGFTDMSQLYLSRNYSLATQCCLRSEPSSRTTLNGEQPYPWDLLQPQDVMSDIEVPNSSVDVDSWEE